MDEIEKKKADRFRFLKRLYEVSEGNQFAFFDEKEVGRDIGLDPKGVDIITQYLEGEHLIEFRGGGALSITHWGVVQIEEALSKPEQATQYFPAVMNIITVHSMVNSQIQQGTVGSSQRVELDQSALLGLLSEIKATFSSMKPDTEVAREILAEIKTIEAQLESSHPKQGIIREALTSLRNVLEQAGAGLLATKIASMLFGSG